MKKNFSITLCLILLLTVVSFAETGTGIKIEGVNVQFSDATGIPFVDSNARTQVPFRVTLEKFGAAVDWDNVNRIAIAEKNGTVVKIPIGENYILKNNMRFNTDTSALIKDGKTYLPIRPVLEALGGNVGWDNTTKTVLVTSGLELKVHFIDVGQGDSIFIDYGDFDILIDAGDNNQGNTVVSYLKSLNTDDIEIMVATHPDADHIGGLDDVLEAFQVEQIIDSGVVHTTKTYEDYLDAVLKEKESGAIIIKDDDMSFDLGNDIKFEVIETGDDNGSNNNNSVVSRLVYGDVEFLFTGDMESEAEKEILDKHIEADILKVGHHGSSSSSSREFLKLVKPEVAVISYAEDNKYGHPHLETLVALGSSNVKNIYDTANSGHIIISTDGNTYQVSTQKDYNYADKYNSASTQPIEPQQSNLEIVIKSIDLAKEIVVIENKSSKVVNMTGWKLISEKGNQIYEFPTGYVLGIGKSVEVVSGKGATGNGTSKLLWTTGNIWNNDGDPGALVDSTGKEVSRY